MGPQAGGWLEDPRVVSFFESAERRPDVVAFHAMTTALATPPPGGHVLDVGCGVGVSTVVLGELVGPLGTVIGLDDRRSLLDAAIRVAQGPVRFEHASLHPLEFPDDEFDYVRSTWTFKPLVDPMTTVKELVRVCVPGGQVVLVDVDARSVSVDAPGSEVVERVLGSVFGPPSRQRAGQELRGHLVRAGCQDVVVSPYVFTHTSLADAAGLVPDLNRDLPSRLPHLSDGLRASWFDALERADAAGELLVSVTAWAAAGRKSEQPRR